MHPPPTPISSLLWSWAGGCPCSSEPHQPHWPAGRCWACWANGSSPSAVSGHAAAGRAPGRRPPQTRRLWRWLGSPPHFCVWFSLEQRGSGTCSLFCNPKKDRNRTTYCGKHGLHAHISHTLCLLLSEGLSLTQNLHNTVLLLWCVSELFPSPGPPTPSFLHPNKPSDQSWENP